MARINIEDSLHSDDRYQNLIEKLADRYKALGMITAAFILAQKHWTKHRGIPEDNWPASLDILLEVRLAERTFNESGMKIVYIKGSNEQFAWLEQKSAAGKSVSNKKLEALEKARHKKTLNGRSENTERELNGTERPLNVSEPLSHSHSLSLSLSPSLTHPPAQTHSKKGSSAKKSSAASGQTHDLIKLYCDLWMKTYKTSKSPPITGKETGIFSKLHKDVGFERAKSLIQAYLRMPDQWFVTKRHDAVTLTANLNAISLFADNGKMISNKEIRELDKKVATQNLLDAIDRGEI
jgi:hypothetical protein